MKYSPTSKTVALTWHRAFYVGHPFNIPKSRKLSEVPIGTIFHLDEASWKPTGWKTPWVLWTAGELRSIPESRVPPTVKLWLLLKS